jgi:hypothetical protein
VIAKSEKSRCGNTSMFFKNECKYQNIQLKENGSMELLFFSFYKAFNSEICIYKTIIKI